MKIIKIQIWITASDCDVSLSIISSKLRTDRKSDANWSLWYLKNQDVFSYRLNSLTEEEAKQITDSLKAFSATWT